MLQLYANNRKGRTTLPRAAFMTLGCKVNQFETETMEGLFHRAGYQVVPFGEAADVCVINTCSVTALGEKKSRQIIRRARRETHRARLRTPQPYRTRVSNVQNARGRERQRQRNLSERTLRRRYRRRSARQIGTGKFDQGVFRRNLLTVSRVLATRDVFVCPRLFAAFAPMSRSSPRDAATAPFLFILSRTSGTVCWMGTSMYLTACGEVRIQSRNSSEISLGYE